MIAVPEILAIYAKEAGMKVPDDPEDFDSEQYPHFDVFSKVQLGASMPYPSAGLDNARVVASISEKKIRKVTFRQLVDMYGFAIGRSKP